MCSSLSNLFFILSIIIIIILLINITCCITVQHTRLGTIERLDVNMGAKADLDADSDALALAPENAPYKMPSILAQVLTPTECKNIIKYCEDKLVDSSVLSGKNNKVRDSKQCWIDRNNPLVKDLFRRMSTTFGINFDNAEHLQVVRYFPGQFYNYHHDSCDTNNKECVAFLKRGGQRILTILIYLNNEFTDGETSFKNLNLKMKPKTGDAVVFYPLATNSRKCHPKALHAGLPVTSGEKWIANIWFRERAFV